MAPRCDAGALPPLVNQTAPGSGGRTALATSCAMGHRKVVQLLLGAGADCYQHDDQDMSPLMLAAQGGHADVIAVCWILLVTSPAQLPLFYSSPQPIILSEVTVCPVDQYLTEAFDLTLLLRPSGPPVPRQC